MSFLQEKVNSCCKFGDFTLTSGKKSDFYVDVKALMFDPRTLALLGEELYIKIEQIYGNIDCVGGMELGSIPLSSAIAIYSYARGGMVNPWPHFVVRKRPRDHGTLSQIEGVCSGDIVIVDDVLTTGGSIIKTKSILEDAGHTVIGAIVVVDREEAIKIDIPVASLFTKSGLQSLQ